MRYIRCRFTMVKTISQDTFDAVVKENIQEFDLNPQDAIHDAVQQFEAQGIDLSNIVKDKILQTRGSVTDEPHPVVAAVNGLSEALSYETFKRDMIKMFCQHIISECDKDLAHRCLAGTHNAYSVLVLGWSKCTHNSDLLVYILKALISLTSGQPDLLESKGLEHSLSLLKLSFAEDNDELLLLTLKFVSNNCIQHERNRQSYVENGLISILVTVLDQKRFKKEKSTQTCFNFRVLTYDDDVRAAYGKAHDHARMIVGEEKCLEKILSICKVYIDEKSVLSELFSTLARLAVRNEFCQQIMDIGGLQLMLDSLARHIQHPSITKQTVSVLKAVAGNDAVKSSIVTSGGLELIINALEIHIKNPAVCEVSCSAVATLVLRNPHHCKRAMEVGTADVLTKILQIHPNQHNIQKQVCMAIRNLVARTREYSQIFLALDVEHLLQQTLKTHDTCKDEAKAALRDLGCQITLQECWKGEGKGLNH